jgi:PhnB protein
MTQINAYLTFDGNCRQAMTFYNECLGGELKLQTVGDSPPEAQMPGYPKQNIMHSTIIKDGIILMASDVMSAGSFTNGSSISLALNCSSEEEITSYYNRLSTGGKIIHPLKTEFWGGTFGMFTDKFGLNWLLNYQPEPPK